MRSGGGVGEVEHLELDRHSANTATHLERIDSFTDEVTKQLRPCTLFTVARVPHARLAGSVVAAGPEGGVCAGSPRVLGGALVPVGAGQVSSCAGCDGVGER